MPDNVKPFDRLIQITAKLRDPNGGCPWDLEQTHQTLKPYVIEEAHEVVDAIDAGPDKLRDELGDLLLQVMLHSQIATEAGDFTIDDVVRGITEKMIHRHPHVFGDVKVKDSDEVLRNWEQKKREKLAEDKSILDGVPRSMPALLRAQRVGEKAARVGFEWPTLEGVRDKVYEEMNEFLEHLPSGTADREKLEDEFGDILFALTQLARRLKLNSEDLLSRATDKFSRRFKEMEKRAARSLADLTIDELDAIWEEVKQDERKA
ncbi:MAG: nucleoside triphosphate pyrophosphohydrolase [Deltaproteobacteria bacterium]|nr:nucleoside triphosphate pyrophosphohydrolase [Deltaproteobacteria bacterium]